MDQPSTMAAGSISRDGRRVAQFQVRERHPPTPKPGWRMNMTVVPWRGSAALPLEVGDLLEGQGGDPVAQRAQRVLQVTRIDHPEVGEPEVIQYHMH